MVPEGFANTPSSRTDTPAEVFGGGRYLRVDQSANRRANSVISKIWHHGFEIGRWIMGYVTSIGVASTSLPRSATLSVMLLLRLASA